MTAVTWTGGTEHWIKRGDINLFLWQKKANPNKPFLGTIFFVHGVVYVPSVVDQPWVIFLIFLDLLLPLLSVQLLVFYTFLFVHILMPCSRSVLT